MKPMKILQTPVRFKPYIGGVENYVYGLSKQLAKNGYDVKVICASEPISSKTKENIEGIEVNRLKFIGKIANTNITPMLPFKLLREDFDIIHTHIPTPWSADWSAIISALKRKKLIVTYHNDIVGKGFMNYIAKLYNRTMLQFVLKTAHKIIITQEKYIEHSPYLKRYKNKIVVIPVGIDTQRFRPMKGIKKGKNIVGFLSVLDEYHRYKGLDYLLRAISLAKEKIPEIKLLVGGSGALLPEYMEMAKEFGIAQNVEFLEFIPEDKLVEFYNKLDVFVLPSTSSDQEGFGTVLMEALACGTPVIATKIAGIAREIKSNDLGFIINPHDHNEISEALIKILSMNHKIKPKRAVNHQSSYSWKKLAARHKRLYV